MRKAYDAGHLGRVEKSGIVKRKQVQRLGEEQIEVVAGAKLIRQDCVPTM